MFAAEGLWFIVIPGVLFLLTTFIGVWKGRALWFIPAIIFFIAWFAMMYFFRDPARPKPPENSIVAPTDGIVDSLTILPDGRAHLEIFLSLLDVHAIRSPATGVVIEKTFVPGEFIPAQRPESSAKNQRVDVLLDTEYGPLLFSAISGAIARRVIVNAEVGDTLLTGQRIGIVRFGSRSSVTLPAGLEVMIDDGERVFGGVTQIADIIHDVADSLIADTVAAEGVSLAP